METSSNMTEATKTLGSDQPKKLTELKFVNSALHALPVDKEERNFVRRSISGVCFSKVMPTPVKNPVTVAYSDSALSLLDVDPQEASTQDFAEYFAGNKILPGSEPAAHCYCGHQFGNFAGQLGDGRAILLGEIINRKGERWELQLKGAGQTPYSRDGDGRAVLRSSIREFLCSEAMHALGIPTTRAGCIISSDTTVVRDLRYDGNPKRERATTCLRISPTFLRFGSFQIANGKDETTGRAGPSVGRQDIIRKMLFYTIQTHYPHIWSRYNPTEDQEQEELEIKMFEEFFQEITLRTARLVAEWQCVGWGHGVLNTDNMSIVGVTIDYGPFGFVDFYDPEFICNASDNTGRYSLKNQPFICGWNLERLSDALAQLLPKDKSRGIIKEHYQREFDRHYSEKMHKKLGLFKSLPGDAELIQSLLDTMRDTGADFTNVFRNLSKLKIASDATNQEEVLSILLAQCCDLEFFLPRFEPRLPPHQLQQLLSLARTNPDLLSMMGLSEELLHEEAERLKKYQTMEDYTQEQKTVDDRKLWTEWLTKYKARLAQEVDSGSTEDLERTRVQVMNANNPKFILRNYLAQMAIEKAEKGDFSEVHRLHKLLQDPFGEGDPALLASHKYDSVPPRWSLELCVT